MRYEKVFANEDCIASMADKLEMSMKNWWNNTEKGKHKYSKKNLSQCHSVNHKSQIPHGLAWVQTQPNPCLIYGG
jgi:hypothetical protein